MPRRFFLGRLPRLLATGALLASAVGCSYVSDRYHDALDMLDIGITLTKKPKLAAFKACTGLACVGYSNLDGYFIGIGGGRFGAGRYISKGYGVGVWGKIKNTLTDEGDAGGDAGEYEQTGFVAAATGQARDASCVQQLHIGWAGIVFNIKWKQILDFFLGWTTVDICHDDGTVRYGWFSHRPATGRSPRGRPGLNGEKQPPPRTAVASLRPPRIPRRPQPVILELRRYTIRSGDRGLIQIAREQLGDGSRWREIAELNCLRTPYALEVGQELWLPPADRRTPFATGAGPHAATSETPAVRTLPVVRKYVVRKGDIGLIEIARRELGDARRWKQIVKLNGLQPPYAIYPGEELWLPE